MKMIEMSRFIQSKIPAVLKLCEDHQTIYVCAHRWVMSTDPDPQLADYFKVPRVVNSGVTSLILEQST